MAFSHSFRQSSHRCCSKYTAARRHTHGHQYSNAPRIVTDQLCWCSRSCSGDRARWLCCNGSRRFRSLSSCMLRCPCLSLRQPEGRRKAGEGTPVRRRVSYGRLIIGRFRWLRCRTCWLRCRRARGVFLAGARSSLSVHLLCGIGLAQFETENAAEEFHEFRVAQESRAKEPIDGTGRAVRLTRYYSVAAASVSSAWPFRDL